MSTAAPRPLFRPLAILLSILLAFAGLIVTASPAAAAPGDVAGATLQWGLKQSFRNYLVSPIAHGGWTASGVTDATPFGWSGGSGSATGGTGTVAYPGSLHFTGHQGFGVGPDEYALDLSFSDVKVVVTSATTADLVLDARSRDFANPTAFVELNDVVFATLALGSGTPTASATTIGWSNVPATLTATGASAFGGFYGEGTALDPVSFSWPIEPEADPEPVAPTVSVSPSTGLESGDVVTVTGTGFGPTADGGPLATRPPLSGKFGGVYVTFGTFLDVWKPSDGAPSSARKVAPGTTKWFVNPEDVATVGAAGGGVAISPDGSFSLEITVTEDFQGALAEGNYGIYTYPGGGAVHAPFETYTPITFADDVVPTVTVSPSTDLESGDVVTVTGTGFGPDAEGGPLGTRPPLSGKFGGVYVTFGTFLDLWKPSEGAPSSARKTAPGTTRWFVNAEDVATVGAAGGGVAINSDGSFSLDIVVTEDFVGALADGNYGIYTYPGSGAVSAPFETYTPITFADATTPTTPPVDPGVTLAPGSLSWGVKASFSDYVTGSIAKGSISVGNGAGVTGGAYWFPQATAGSAVDTGTIAYRGSVTFTGHGGELTLRLADPTVRITGASTGVLSVATSAGRVDFATLNLGAATVTTDATGARTYAAAPATLTTAGAGSFAGFYAAGTALDPVTFTVGSENSTTGRATTTSAVTAAANTPDATPPATEGVLSDSEEFVEGGEYTFTADGFQPNESDILAVIYSTPTVLADDLAADASGTVTWTGKLPAGLTGEHTFTFQGSVDRGIVIDIAAAEVVGCEVDGAVLDWGFKESFRAYIDGSIANGEWTTADGATYETPLFSWATGAGGYDAETGDADLSFTGSVRFTGHGGVLDTTISRPRIVIDGDSAVLFLDVTGTTQTGEPVAAVGVEFAELDLAGAERAGGGDLVAFTGIPATLAAAGAAAFGTYEAGSALDPIDLSITVDPACVQPAVAVTTTDGQIATEPVSSETPWLWIVLAIFAALIVAAVVAVLVVRRARRA